MTSSSCSSRSRCVCARDAPRAFTTREAVRRVDLSPIALAACAQRSPGELSSYHRKVHEIDRHLGIAVAGLTADGRILSRYMRNESINHRFVFDSSMPVSRLVRQVADKHQANTMQSWSRPYGVGLLVAGYDSTGPRLFQVRVHTRSSCLAEPLANPPHGARCDHRPPTPACPIAPADPA